MARSMKVAMLACLFALSMTGTLSTTAAASDAPVSAGPEPDYRGEQVLLSTTPQGCLEKLVGAQRAPCFYRQQWNYDGSQSQLSTIQGGFIRTRQAAITGYGEAGSACPASGVDLGSMKEVITGYTSESLDSYLERKGTLGGFNATQKCTLDASDSCDMTLDSKCVLKYNITTPAGAPVDEASSPVSATSGPAAEPGNVGTGSANKTNIMSSPAPPRSASNLPVPGVQVALLVIFVLMSIAV